MRLSQNCLGQVLAVAGLLMGSLLLTGCLTGSPKTAQPNTAAQTNAPVNVANIPFRAGDKVRIELTGAPTQIPPIEEEIKEDGTISLMHLGSVNIVGKTPAQAEEMIQTNYVPAYFLHLTVTVNPLDRFFYVGGLVNRPSEQRYNGPMTVTKAIQAAGDFTDFASRKNVQLTRVGGKIEIVNYDEVLKHPELDPPVYPGDKIDVFRRW